jgi:hypothetical protein
MKKKQGSTNAPFSPKQLSASLTLVERASQPFAGAPRLTPLERKHATKLPRGAHSIVPTIAALAQKHGLVAPGHATDAMLASLDEARAIEPLLGAVTVLQESLRDQQLIRNGNVWTIATATYAMLAAGANASVDIARELAPVKEWFAHRSRSSKKASADKKATKKAKTAPPIALAEPSAEPASTASAAGQPKGSGVVVNGGSAAHALS